MSKVFSNMGLSSSKPFQFSLSDIFEKVRCYSACCGGQVIIEELNDTERQEIVAKILTLLNKLCLLLYLRKIL